MEKITNYPFVFVHGFSGWGEKDWLNKVVPYFGWFSGNARKFCKEFGVEAHMPSVGPFTSAWDRACELYAQLTGTTVDYGKVHSERNGHARFGRTYKKAMVPNWGKLDKFGKIQKINLVGHSYGGPTVNLLINLLEDGSAEEKAGTPESELSELFKGGHKNYVHSFTSLAANHNGTSLVEAAEAVHIAGPVVKLILYAVSLLGTSPLMKVYDQHYEHYGLSEPYKLGGKIEFKIKRDAIDNVLAHPEDISFYNIGVKETMNFTKDFRTFDDIYYFSYAGCMTEKFPIIKKQKPRKDIFPLYLPTALIIGMYKPFKKSAITKDWYANDGMVNTVSALAPFGAPQTDYSASGTVRPGIWNRMPILENDHNGLVGLGRSREDYKAFVKDIVDIPNSVPEVK